MFHFLSNEKRKIANHFINMKNDSRLNDKGLFAKFVFWMRAFRLDLICLDSIYCLVIYYDSIWKLSIGEPMTAVTLDLVLFSFSIYFFGIASINRSCHSSCTHL